MIYEFLYSIAMIAMAVALIFCFRKINSLKERNIDLEIEKSDLEGYTRALHHVNRSNLDTIARLYNSKYSSNQ